MVRMDCTAEASLAEILARNRLGIAMAAMIRIIATTINSSIREKPLLCLECFITSRVPFEKVQAHLTPRPAALPKGIAAETLVQSYGQSALGMDLAALRHRTTRV